MSEITVRAADQLTHWVRSALAHLYDAAFLQIHPLGLVLDTDKSLDSVTRAQKVRRVLLDCIEALRPQEDTALQASAARAFAILTYRYVDGLSMDEIADKLALSRRQTYREHEKGIEAVASLLQDKYVPQCGQTANANDASYFDAHQIAQAEVSRLRQTVRVEPLNVREVLENIAGMLAPLGEQSGVQLNVDVASGTAWALADRVMLRQALISLLTFAIDIAQTQTPIDIGFDLADERLRVTVHVALSDSRAVPCPEDISDELCVELAVSQSLIEAQGGKLVIATRTSKHHNAWQAELLLLMPIKNTILVIDDNADMVALFRRYLSGHHVTVVGVSESKQALLLSVELQPRVIVLDVMMPSLDGWDVLQHLKKMPKTQHIPVIVCSVLNEAKLAMTMGASGYLTKPVNQTELLAMSQQWLGALPPAH